MPKLWDPHGRLSRRDFLRGSAVLLGAPTLGRSFGLSAEREPEMTIGLFTDSHYADRDAAGSRHYRDSAAKLTQFGQTMNELHPSFTIVLGDFVDKGETLEAELGYLNHIEEIYRQFNGPRHHVLGNHDVATLTKQQFQDGTGMPAPYYSFDCGDFHSVVLDANFNPDFSPYAAGNFDWTQTFIPPEEQEWLAADLQKTKKKTLVFIHQPLDDEHGPHGVKNAPEVRPLLEESGQVIAVFQGHNHPGAYRRINGIPYFTLRALVEGPGLAQNAFALARIFPQGEVQIQGFGQQTSLSPEPKGEESWVSS